MDICRFCDGVSGSKSGDMWIFELCFVGVIWGGMRIPGRWMKGSVLSDCSDSRMQEAPGILYSGYWYRTGRQLVRLRLRPPLGFARLSV